MQARLTKKCDDLVPGHKPETSLDSHDPEKMTSNFSSHTLSDPKKSLLSRNLRFALPPTKIDYTDFLVQFELFNRGTMEFTFSS